MEKYPFNRFGYQPYPGSRSIGRCCPEGRPSPKMADSSRYPRQNPPDMPLNTGCQGGNEHVDHMTLAMAYVPYQKWEQPYDLCYALQVGTIFSCLCKPFCGRGGMCR